jgi:hypothetical protein
MYLPKLCIYKQELTASIYLPLHSFKIMVPMFHQGRVLFLRVSPDHNARTLPGEEYKQPGFLTTSLMSIQITLEGNKTSILFSAEVLPQQYNCPIQQDFRTPFVEPEEGGQGEV